VALDVTALLHSALLCAALWTAVSLYRGGRPLRFVAALAAGAAFAHLGWARLHWAAVAGHPAALLDPTLGYCVLFLPLGPLLLAPEAATWRALPLALAVARLGCLIAGGCHGVAAAWGSHPTPLYEVALLLALHLAVRASADARAAAVFLAGFGLARLTVEPWRAAPPLGPPTLDPALLAALWTGVGLLTLLPWRRCARGGLAAGVALLAPAAPVHAPEGETARPALPTPPPPPRLSRRVALDRAEPLPSRPAGHTVDADPLRYRRWLASPRPAERRAALELGALLWDHGALPLLVALESDPSPSVREAARQLVRRYLVWGPRRPGWRERRDANRPGFEPWDRAGLRAWRARGGRDYLRGSPRTRSATMLR
jgi:hypothetical protein